MVKLQRLTARDKAPVWKSASILLALILILPIAAIFYLSVGEDAALFAHLIDTVLPSYALNTVLVTAGVMTFSALWGIPCAWFMARCDIPGRRWLEWMLVLPLAIPGYIVGYIYTDWLDYAGPIQVMLRDLTGWQASDYAFPDIRTPIGASLVLSFVLYPYVYLMCRSAFMEQGVTLMQSARLLGCGRFATFWRVALPLARPAIVVGLSLVAMETIGDFGTVKYFAVNTLTTSIYDTWLSYSNIHAAGKIAATLLLFIALMLSVERYSRRKQRLYQREIASQAARLALKPVVKWCVSLWCWLLVSVAFLLPLWQLLDYTVHYLDESFTGEFQTLVLNSLYVSVLASLFAIFVALIVNFNFRLVSSKANNLMRRLASFGYAVPGTVLAIGVMSPILGLDHFVNDTAKMLGLPRPGLIFSGSVFALVFALVVRFSAIAIGSVESSLNKISPSLDMAARSLGKNRSQMLLAVHFPLVYRAALVAGLLVFIESMKELNAALLLRPFNFETLATHVFSYVSSEQLELAALPAVILVLVGMVPILLVNRSMQKVHS
jgi:iron(III) transport system permease protein